MAGSGGGGRVPSLPPPRPKSPPQYPDLYGKRRELARVQMLEREIGFLEDELKFVDRLHPASRSCKEVTDFVLANPDPLIPTIKKTSRSSRFWKWLCCGISCFSMSWICCCRCPRVKMPSHCCNCSCNPCSGCSECNGCPSCVCCSPSCPSCTPSCTCKPSCSCLSCKPSCSCISCPKSCTCCPTSCFSCPSSSCFKCPSLSCFSCSFPKRLCCCSCPESQCCKKKKCSCSCTCDCSCTPKCPSCFKCSCNKCRCCCLPKCPKMNCCSCTNTCCCNPCFLCF